MPEDVRRELAGLLRRLYVSDADPGVHSAVDWLWRTSWGLGKELDSLDHAWRSQALPAGRNWFVNSEGVTMAVVSVRRPARF